jgi:hypothetical protein
MRKVQALAILFLGVLLGGCAAKKQPDVVTPPPIRSQMPPASSKTIEHCVVTKEENANTVTCICDPATTRIDSKTGHVTLVCKKMKEEK